MTFKKGQSGNPAGRPKGAFNLTALEAAIKTVEKQKGKKLLNHFISQAYKDNSILIAVMKKFIPDRRVQDIMVDASEEIKEIKIVLEAPKHARGKDTKGCNT